LLEKPPILGKEVLKAHVNVNNNPIRALNVCELTKFLLSTEKCESKNTVVTSEFRPEVEIRPFHTSCAVTNTQYNPYNILYKLFGR